MKLTRNELYATVWDKPITRLSKEFGISDVGFAKICRKHNIPLPARGYWARLASGQKIRPTPLPKPNDNPEIRIDVRPAPSSDQLAAKNAQKEKEAQLIDQVGIILVPTELDAPHPLTRATKKFFDDIPKKIARAAKQRHTHQWSPNYERVLTAQYGRYSCYASEGFSLTVSLEKADRALRFLDALVKTLKSHGFTVKNDVERERRGRCVEASKEGEGVSFDMSEGYTRKILSPEELIAARKERSYATEFDMVPSGKLSFTLKSREFWSEHKWADGKNPIEDRLPEIVAEFIDLVPRQKQMRIDRTRAEEESRRRQHREWLIRCKRDAQQAMYKQALAEAEQLESLEKLEIYLKRIELEFRQSLGEPTGGKRGVVLFDKTNGGNP
jgi:hypothetical protein